MKTTSSTTENDNLVLFPSAKNFAQEDLILKDPMVDLLSVESDFEDGTSFGSLEAFMNRHQSSEYLTPDDKLVHLINEKLELISDAKKRIKFYLDEIEMFLPRRR